MDLLCIHVLAPFDMSESGYSLSKYSNSDISILLIFAKNNTIVVLTLIKIKKDILIAAIQRKNKTIFPTGSDVIKENDRVIIVSKDTKIYSLNDILYLNSNSQKES